MNREPAEKEEAREWQGPEVCKALRVALASWVLQDQRVKGDQLGPQDQSDPRALLGQRDPVVKLDPGVTTAHEECKGPSDQREPRGPTDR